MANFTVGSWNSNEFWTWPPPHWIHSCLAPEGSQSEQGLGQGLSCSISACTCICLDIKGIKHTIITIIYIYVCVCWCVCVIYIYTYKSPLLVGNFPVLFAPSLQQIERGAPKWSFASAEEHLQREVFGHSRCQFEPACHFSKPETGLCSVSYGFHFSSFFCLLRARSSKQSELCIMKATFC